MGKLKLNFFDKILLIFAICFAIGLVLGVLAGNYDPRKHIYIAFFGLAYPFFLIANFALLLWWVLRTKWMFAILTIVVIFYGWNTFTASFGIFGQEGEAIKKSENYLRLVTYNVHQFKRYGGSNDASTKQQIIEVVKNQNPDVVCFQEFYTRPKGQFDTIDSIKKALKLSHYYFLPSVKNDFEAYGLAIFSKYPIVKKGNIIFDESLRGNESIFVDVKFKGKLMRFYNVHFQSISFDKQDYDYIDKVTKKMDTEIKSSRRIAGMLKSAFQRRSNQVDIMKENLQTCEIPYVIAGDFNDTPASYAVTQITKPLNNAFRKKGSGFGKTYNGKFPNFQIDYIATTKNIDVINYHITRARLSDHFPVRSDLKLTELSD